MLNAGRCFANGFGGLVVCENVIECQICNPWVTLDEGGSGQAAIQEEMSGVQTQRISMRRCDRGVREARHGLVCAVARLRIPGLPLSRFRCVGRGLRTSSAKSDRGDIKALMAVMSSYEEFLVSGVQTGEGVTRPIQANLEPKKRRHPRPTWLAELKEW